MEIILYNNTSDSNVVNKNIGDGVTVNMIRKVNTSIVNPSFIISGDSYTDQNYLYCDDLSRYYYINNVTLLSGGMIQLDCSVDVLLTYRTEILNLECTIARAEKKFNGYLVDNALPTYAYEEIITKRFPNAMLGDSVILMTMG